MTFVDELVGGATRVPHGPGSGRAGRRSNACRDVGNNDAGIRVVHDQVVLLPYTVDGVDAASCR